MTPTEVQALLRTPGKTVTIEESILRDYFAGQALPALIALSAAYTPDAHPEAVAKGAYQIADAMMARRLER